MGDGKFPHQKVVIWFSLIGVSGYFAFSVWTFLRLKDATMVGDVIGTWKSFAILAFGFWLGSSSGGKSLAFGPKEVTVTNDSSDPVPVKGPENATN